MAVEFYVHKMSEHMDTAEIIEWLVQEGDTVDEHQPIVEVMTDKFTVEVEAPAAGVLAGIRPGCGKGATVPVGEALAFIVQPGEKVPNLPPFGAAGASYVGAAVANEAAPTPHALAETTGRARSTPVARRMAKDLGIDIEQIKGTGPGGRVSEADVRAASTSVPTAPLPAPTAAFTSPLATRHSPPTGDDAVHWQELTAVQRITGERMRESIANAPQFALDVRADATNLLWLREALNDRITLEARARLSVTGLLVKIVAATLQRHPRANGEFAGGKVKLYSAIHVGVAVGTEEGLVVPVVKHADRKSLAEIVGELAAFQEKAKRMHFSSDDLAGGTFTVSNLGMYGVERFQAILNPPQSAILAVGAIVKTPVALPDGSVGVRPLMNLSLTVDHRVLDGLLAAKFLAEIKEKIEKPYFLI